MAKSAEHRLKFAALHRQWWRLHMSEKLSSVTKNPNKQNKRNKQNKQTILFLHNAMIQFL